MISSPRRIVMDFDGVFTRTDSTAAWLMPRLRERPLLLSRSAPWLAGFVLTSRAPAARTRVTRRLMDTAFSGQSADDLLAELSDTGAAFARDTSMTRSAAVDEARSLLAQGDEVTIVSAGMTPLIESWARALDLPVRVCASVVSGHRGRLRWDDHCFGERKVARLTALGWREWDVVYSDSAHDLPLMRGADSVVLVGGDDTLLRRLGRALPGTPVRAVSW
ncbi:haloacid dehalogenase-like hydrolase [Aeromicrobium sp. PE09-221]|uniref:haloacid dehalogenase-like hydrolase n=1 Tax=Aeromicrobium sp. PE09-221 TaxID=1898043 RepID=UPI001123EB71|nr:haloacid dehalogenase-like hydrolase [Aeromicrobium sp. PE09-221]